MLLFKALILGLVQGLTEFIPVSSSGHLIIAQNLLGVSELGLAFDVALHLGTLLALLIIFGKDILELGKSLLGKGKQKHLAWLVVLGTIPAVFFGMLFGGLVENLRSNNFVAVNLILVALVMLWAERYYQSKEHTKEFDRIHSGNALAIGAAQAIAIFPGISRSGATISAGLFSRLDRVVAARFSFLLAIPVTSGAALKVLISREAISSVANQPAIFAIGIIGAFISGFLAIKFLLKFLAQHGLNIFAYYRITLGLLILLGIIT